MFIVDRKKDLIKPGGGFQVWPREVEEALATHPAVAESESPARPTRRKARSSSRRGSSSRAGQQVSERELRDYCRERLAPFKVPSEIAFRDDLPKTMVGKVLRRALR